MGLYPEAFDEGVYMQAMLKDLVSSSLMIQMMFEENSDFA